MSSEARWQEWSPPFAPHVQGKYERRVFDGEMPEPQVIRMHCTVCDERWQTVCATGQVRVHIARFGSIHLHRDPFATKPRMG